MNTKLYIENHCKIKNNLVTLNDNVIFKGSTKELKPFLKELYVHLGLQYPKFFKMDNLSKIAFLASEIVLKNTAIDFEKESTAIVFSNNASSLETDRKHQQSIEDKNHYFPSPATFVYTLPNICIGEISIKHQLKSENAFFVSTNYNATLHYTYENNLIQSKKADKVLGGWVNVDTNNKYETYIYLISKTGKIEHTINQLSNLYNK